MHIVTDCQNKQLSLSKMKTLRPYQVEAETVVLAKLKQNIKRQLVVFATGLGKTTVATKILNNPLFKKKLWITHTEELIIQSAKAIISEIGDGRVGIIKQERFDMHCEVVVASIQTLHRRLDKIDANAFDCIIIDETHLAMAPTWLKAAHHFNFKLLLGLTATPDRLDGISLGNLYDEIVIEKDIGFGIDEGYLVELNAIRLKTEVNLDKVRTTGGELNSRDLEALVNTPSRNNYIVDRWMVEAKGLKTLAFCVDMQHAIDLCSAFRAKGILADFVVSDESLCPDRKGVMARFAKGETTVLVNVMILTAGYDQPDVACIITARPTKSKTIYLQQIGRGTRPVCNVNFDTTEERLLAIADSVKPKCLIIDVVDGTRKHELINTYTLDKEAPIGKKLFKTKKDNQEDLFKLERKRKLEHQQLIDEKVSLRKPPKVKISTSPRMQEDATEKQLKWLADLGYDVVNVTYTKRDCSELITNSKPYDWMIKSVERLGFDTAHLTLGQAQLILKDFIPPSLEIILREEEKSKVVTNNIVTTNEKVLSKVQLPFHDIK
jgi:superfamily II DNA or RNA helicase